MGRLLGKTKRQIATAKADSALDPAVKQYLLDFLTTHRGVEAWIEEPTGINKASILLVAADGEYTRRSVGSPAWAFDFAAKNDIPAYQAGVVGYPQRMRDYDARRRAEQRRNQP